MWLLAFLALPIIEIALFIVVGGWIGLWPTLGLVVLAAVSGAAVMRRQGLQTLRRLQAEVDAGGDPAASLVDGALVLVAGALLVLPGFFTDAVALILLVPAARAALIRGAAKRALRPGGFVHVRRARHGGGPAHGGGAPRRSETIEGEYEVLDDVPPSQRGASGWTRPQS